ncbi:peptidoglycan editing factor PgeF [Luteipulveratus sp. YIM 133132]|uniref:Purine nucleoside phosphorylase n=1 Tax=Luteipulveratus flavus TaxID=3031728 RepID=A0ABT6C5U0_9MICO|nr:MULTISPECIES: peptidoglycan editing factor PgeF [unclassified Luteipulveratus]MDE9366479.1 peptidoglycan editing factor PgeF [Luteipulveratus sp. YIM 133132]MDF8264247.1 peptidoglycan editing factor PgeF [Luteipulveratus sp. YIM 133296]
MIAWQDRVHEADSPVDRFFTDAVGGVSGAPYTGLNLGAHVGDRPEDVERNRRLLAEAVGVPRDRLVFMNQVHGADVEVVDGPRAGEAEPHDAVITAATDLALVVLVADCTPVLLSAPDAGLVAAVHAGRPGMTAGVVAATVDRMRQLGARQVSAAVGPSVCGRCYEVPEAMREAAVAASPSAGAVSWTGTPAVDVAAGVVEQLRTAGAEVTWVPGCTRESETLYSYRAEPRTGRFAGVVVQRESH